MIVILKRISAVVVSVVLSAVSGIACAEPFEGYTVISPSASRTFSIIDLDGTVLRTLEGATQPSSFPYVLPNGSVIRPCKHEGVFNAGGYGGRVQWFDRTGAIAWDYLYCDLNHQQHHDVTPLPNGNVLLLAWERKTRDEAIAMGRVNISGDMWPETIVEVKPTGPRTGQVVWKWSSWDHMVQDVDPDKPNYGVVADHPELFDINYGNLPIGDWMHANSLDYNPELDQILFSSRKFNEFYVIDHSTTTEEAASHAGGNSGKGGDLLYRWGNPRVYGRGTDADQYFHVLHGAIWIDAGLPGEGNILAFNNGDRPGSQNDYSSVVEIVPPLDVNQQYQIVPDSAFGPAAPVWLYGDPGQFYAGATQCGAFRLPNGNTLITSTGEQRIFEVNVSGVIEWTYEGERVARAPRYWIINDRGWRIEGP